MRFLARFEQRLVQQLILSIIHLLPRLVQGTCTPPLSTPLPGPASASDTLHTQMEAELVGVLEPEDACSLVSLGTGV